MSRLPLCHQLQTEMAESTAALFTRDGEQANNLFDMQVGGWVGGQAAGWVWLAAAVAVAATIGRSPAPLKQ